MKKALLIAPMGSVYRRFNKANISALIDLGYEVHLLANFESNVDSENLNKDFVNKCIENGIQIHSLPYQRHSLLKNIKLIKATKNVLKSEKFDIVHAHTETGGYNLSYLRIKQLLGEELPVVNNLKYGLKMKRRYIEIF